MPTPGWGLRFETTQTLTPNAPLPIQAGWMNPFLGTVNVQFDQPLQPGFHSTAHYQIRRQSLDRQIDQVETDDIWLKVAPGIPSPQGGPDRITYDGLDPTILGTTGLKVQAFDIPIER